MGFPGGSQVNNLSAMQEMVGSSLGGEDSLKEGMQPTSAFLSGESHGLRSLESHCPWGHKESDATECLSLSH